MAYLRFSLDDKDPTSDDRFYIYMSALGLVWMGPDQFYLYRNSRRDIETAKQMKQALTDFLLGVDEDELD